MNAKVLVLVSLVFLAMITSTASALTVTGTQITSMCQCDNAKFDYEVCSTVSGTYNISAQGMGAKWVTIAPASLTFSGSECKKFFVFVSPECYATSSTFPIDFVVSGPETNKITLQLGVNQCHTFDYTVNPLTATALPCQESVYNVFVKNTSIFSDEFVFTQAGLLDSWVTYPQEKFNLNSGEELNTAIKVNVPCFADATTTQFSLALSNTRTNSSKTVNLTQNVLGFIPVGHNLPATLASCAQQDKNVAITVTNLAGAADEFTVTLSDTNGISLSKSILLVGANSVGETVLQIARMLPQEKNFMFSITSKNYSRTYNTNIRLGVSNCYDLSIERVSSSNEYCFEPVEQTFVLKNFGTQAVSGVVSVRGISASPQEVSLASGEVKNISFTLTPSVLGGANAVVSFESPLVNVQLPFAITFRDCYAFSVTAPTETIDVNCITANCPDGVLVDINIMNDGRFDQTFSIQSVGNAWITLSENNVLAAPSETKTVYAFCAPKNVASGKTDANILVTNNRGTAKIVTIDLDIAGDCNYVPKNAELAPLDLGMKEMSFFFTVRNDSNLGFTIEDLKIDGYSAKADFNRGVFLDVNESMDIKLTPLVDVGLAGKDVNMLVVVTTSQGLFSKMQQVHIPGDVSPLAGFFMQYSASALLGIIVLIIIVVLVVMLLRVRKVYVERGAEKERVLKEERESQEKKHKAKK